MKSDRSLSSRREQTGSSRGTARNGGGTVGNAGGAANETYTWSAESWQSTNPLTITVRARAGRQRRSRLGSLDNGDRVTLSWSGINTAAGVRRHRKRRRHPEDHLTLPVEFVRVEQDDQYVRFKVAVPADDLARSRRSADGLMDHGDVAAASLNSFEEAVVDCGRTTMSANNNRFVLSLSGGVRHGRNRALHGSQAHAAGPRL